MKKLHSLSASLLLVVILFISGCGKNGDDIVKCGETKTWSSQSVFNSLIYSELDLASGNRIFIYEDITTPEDICIDEQTKATYTVFINNNTPPPDVSIRAKAYYGQSGESEAPLTYSGSYYKTEQYYDLSSQFSTDPGWIGLQVKFVFPTQGSFSLDSAYIKNYISSIDIEYIYQQTL